jgi:hypothetical protein
MSFRFFILIGIPLFIGATAALEIPRDFAEQFKSAQVSEDGRLAVADGSTDELVAYIKAHWRELLDGIESIPDPPNPISKLSIIGAAAENLQPMEYLDFLDKYLDTCERSKLPGRYMVSQLAGSAKKSFFLAVNFEHPRVRNILHRALDLLPEDAETEASRELIRTILAGELADSYMTNVPEDTPPPETLPGIKLRKPWASILDKIKPEVRPNPAERGTGNGKGLGDGSAGGALSGSDTDSRDQPGRGVLTGAILLLLGAIYIFFFQKAKAARKGRSRS